MKVLVLDDDPIVRSFLQGVLARRGYEVKSYPSPDACPLYASPACPCGSHDDCPDAILTDVRMPGADGFDFVTEQRRKGCRCRHVGLMSGTWSDIELARAKQMGLPSFAKPFHLESLLAWLAKAGQKKRLVISAAAATTACPDEPTMSVKAS